MSHTSIENMGMSHGTHMNESQHTYERVMSHASIESQHTSERVVSHTSIDVCDMTLSYGCDTTLSYVCCDFIDVCDMTLSYVYCDSFTCVL